MLSCNNRLNLDDWLLRIELKFAHMGTINCRKMRGKGLQSEHSYGTAIDISTVDGASVQEDWGKDSSKGKKLKKLLSAYEHFSNVLTPDTNTHINHFILIMVLGTGVAPNHSLNYDNNSRLCIGVIVMTESDYENDLTDEQLLNNLQLYFKISKSQQKINPSQLEAIGKQKIAEFAGCGVAQTFKWSKVKLGMITKNGAIKYSSWVGI